MLYNLNKYPNSNTEYISKIDVKNLRKTLYDTVSRGSSIRTNIYKYIHVMPNTSHPSSTDDCKVLFSFNNEIYNYLMNQNLHLYLGIYEQYFDCIMHNDCQSKGSIFQKDDGGWVYKCFYDDCRFKVGDINKLTECLTGLNRPDTLDFLMKVYNIELFKNEEQIRQEKILEANIELLMDIDRFKNNYPELHNRIKNYIPQLIILHNYAKRNLSLQEAINNNYVAFSAPVRQIAEDLIKSGNSGTIANVSKRNNIMTFIGMLLKLSDDDLPYEQIQRMKDFAVGQGWSNYQNFYGIPSYSYDVLIQADKKSEEFKETGMTVKGFSREMLKSGFVEQEVKTVYPRQYTRSTNSLHDDIADVIKSKILQEIKTTGYCLENDITKNGYFVRAMKNKLKIHDREMINKKTVELVFKIYLPDIINSYDLKRGRLTNALKAKFKISVKGSPNVLYLKQK